MAIDRPDIATQVKYRKAQELKLGIQAFTGKDKVRSGEIKLMTSSPVCAGT